MSVARIALERSPDYRPIVIPEREDGRERKRLNADCIPNPSESSPMPIDPEKSTVILAAHGSRREPVANAIVQEHARRLQEEYGCRTVKVAFRQGTPAFGNVLDTISVDEVTVVPFFAADGYYARTVLPRELSLNQRYPQMRLHFTKAVGTHPGISSLVAQRVRKVVQQFHLKADQTALIVVGHGTRRHASSSASTRTVVEDLRKLGVCSEVHSAFLDEPPRLEEVFGALWRAQIVVFPFFMGGSYHVLQDLPRRLGMENRVGTPFPAQATRAGQQVVFDRAIGSDEGMTSIIAELAAHGRSAQE